VLILLGAMMWGTSTLYVKRVMAQRMSAFRLLYIQILVSTPLLLAAALLLERGWFFAVTPLILGALFFQGVVVVFFSYLMWMILLRRHSASTMQSYTFLSPAWGVFFGVTLLGDPLQGLMVLGIAFVGLGLYLVNRPRPGAAAG
jgi:drug/metabolite transporter (DMT)-like permease